MVRSSCHMIILLVFAAFLGGCVATGSGPKITVEPMAKTFNEMPIEAATITSAVAMQTLTTPIEKFGRVRFAQSADGLSDPHLAVKGFELTNCILYSYFEPYKDRPGKVTGALSYTDLFDRKAEFAFAADYVRMDNELVINRLRVERKYAFQPRIRLLVAPSDALDGSDIKSYDTLVRFLAEKAIQPESLKKRKGIDTYTIFVVSEDLIPRDAKIDIAISASKSGYSGYKKESRSYTIDGWPIAVMSGKFDPNDRLKPLFAKIFYKQAGGSSQLLDVYQIAAF